MKVSKRPGVAWLIMVGAFVAALGIFAIAMPYVAGTAVAILLGAALLIAGIGEIVQSFSHGGVGRKLGGLILGVITAIAGVMALAEPWVGLAALTLMLSGALIASGVWRIVAMWSYRETTGCLWLAFSGVIGIALGVMILVGWPESSLWAIGTLVGVDLLVTGISLVSLGIALRRRGSAPDQPVSVDSGAPAAPA